MAAPSDLAGERIRAARILFGITQTQLAESAGVTQALISAVENGAKAASESLIRSAASATGAPLSFFSVVPNEIPLGSLRFRKTASAGRTHTKRAEILLQESYRVANILCRKGDYPFTDLPRAFETPSVEGIEQLAADTRESLQINREGPIPHLIRACERAGIPVAPMVLPGETSTETPTDIGHYGISYWAGPGENAFIGYFPGSRADRDRFTIAHEIGHLVLHAHRPRASNAEDEANKFASALLFPGDRAKETFHDSLNLSDYARLKAVWGVSIQAMIMRAEHLGLVSSDRKKALFKQISARGWRKNEPVTVHAEQPALLWRLLKFSFGDRFLSAASDELAIPRVVLRSLIPRPDSAGSTSKPTSDRSAKVVELHPEGRPRQSESRIHRRFGSE